MRKLFLFLILTAPGLLLSKSYTLHSGDTIPVIYLDSAIYEVKKGRSCENVKRGLLLELINANELLVEKALKIELQNKLMDNLDVIITENDLIHDQEKKGLKSKIKRLWGWITLEGILIIVLVLI